MASEQELIERIRKALPPRAGARGLLLGIGDDAALVRPSRRTDWVLSCDSFLEGIHFLDRSHSPDSVGYKSLARATSDLAAMGATPRYFLLSLALPAGKTGNWLDGFLSGLGRAARSFRISLAGGDTAQFPQVVISITVVGELEPGLAVRRSGARPGHILYVSGTLGSAQLGLELVLRGWDRTRRWQPLLRHHLYPQPRLALGSWLARNRLASAMIDLSDGLSTDLARLCQASGVGARLEEPRIPAVRVPAVLQRRGFNRLAMALHGGDDYVLLFTVPSRLEKRLRRAPGAGRLSRIGEITREKNILLVSREGRETRLEPRGWDHFRKK
jgi:thiamine-monophosphate kinase